MSDQFEQLAQLSTVVADTGDLDSIRHWQPVDATTNPSLLLATARDERYGHLLDEARQLAVDFATQPDAGLLADAFAVTTGSQILEHISGRVSTEVDAHLSFDTAATIHRARRLTTLYAALGIAPERFLIKIAGTWEGIRAAEVLEQEGINCNITLVFHLAQARAAAEADAYLISPFVGRIYDWYKRKQERDFAAADDPGVLSVRGIYHYFISRDFNTRVMAASFRNADQIRALAGCDLLTISPALLETLAASTEPLPRRLDPSQIEELPLEPALSEPAFRFAVNGDAMATELLADGIRRFCADQQTLESLFG